MTTYLLLNGQLRAETDEAAIANLRRKGWQDAPAKPSQDAQWTDGAWVVPPAPTYTPEAWVAHQDFAGQRPTTLLYLKLQLDAAGKSSPKLAAVQAWLDGMIVAGVTNPNEARSDWPVALYGFQEASAEAVAALQS
jgi:hypothetical protein